MSENLPVGAHLVTPRRWYDHHGVYVGGGRVVHYSGYCKGIHSGPVEEVDLADFELGRGLRVCDDGPAVFSPAEIAARARSRVGESRYHLLDNNCEHFCEWCVTGRSHSRQVERLLALPVAIVRRIGRRLVCGLAELFGDSARRPSVRLEHPV